MISKSKFRLKKNGEPTSICYCTRPELIENYDKAIADKTQVWEVHHRREEFYSQKELVARGEYYDVKPEELIFLTPAEHRNIDSKCKRHSEVMKGRQLSEEHKRKMSETRRKKVLCIETGIIYESIGEAAELTNSNRAVIGAVCRGRHKTANNFHWRFV